MIFYLKPYVVSSLLDDITIFYYYPYTEKVCMKPKYDPMPWRYLDEFRGKDFEGQWPTLVQMFDITVKRYPQNRCYEVFLPKHDVYSYPEAQAYQKKIASYLSSLGVKKGDVVGLTGKNSPEWAMAYFAILRIGASVAPVDISLTDAEIEHLLDFVHIKGLFIDGDRYDRIGLDNKYGFKISLEEKNHESSYILNLPDLDCSYEEPCIDDIAAYLFTSGTTGTPKAVMLTHSNLSINAYQAVSIMNTYPTEVLYAILPIHHAYTMLAVFLEAVVCGANLVFGKRLSINQMLKEMKMAKVTVLLFVPMVYNKLLAALMKGVESKGETLKWIVDHLMIRSGFIKEHFGFNPGKFFFSWLLKKASLNTVRMCISGGGPLPPETFRKFNELGLDFIQGYGLTESSPILTLNPPFDYEEKSIGKPLPMTEISFGPKDSMGNGEILARGPQVMKGYYNNPEATAEVLDSDGWLHTGDVGYMDDRGFIYLTGRAKNIIVTEGGKNVFPEEIEDHFQLYDDVEQICVIGYVQDKSLSSEGVAAIVYPSESCRKRYEGKDEELYEHIFDIISKVNKDILPYKRISKLIVASSPMEMTSTKKIRRFAVKKQYEEQLS